ncbi:MAG: hypothetical protein GY832_03575 [Chloroflexi bacterium]|nr:hypothetical protein [Chloroflexota bacterium]
MKTLHRHIYLILLILLVSLVGCSDPVVPTLSPTSAPTFTATPLPTVVPSPTPSPQLSTDTPIPSPTPSPTFRPTPVANLKGSIVFVSRRTDFNQDGELNEADGTDLYIIDVVTREHLQVTSDVHVDQHPRWSPDKTQIAFSSNRDGDFEIFVIGEDGSGLRQITHNTVDDRYPTWSPNADRLSFVSDESGISEVYFVDLETGDIVQQTRSDEERYFSKIDWSPADENLLLVTTQESVPMDEDWSFFAWRIWILDLTTGEMILLTPEGWTYDGARWSPDGTRIVTWTHSLTSDGGGQVVVGILSNSDGIYALQSMQPIHTLGTFFSWSPNGTSIAYTSLSLDDSSDLNIYLLGRQGIWPEIRLIDDSFFNQQGDWR